MMDISVKDKGLNIALRGTLGIRFVCRHRCSIDMQYSI